MSWLEELGSAGKVMVNKDTTTIIDGEGDAQRLDARVNTLKAQLEDSDSDLTVRSCKSGWRNLWAASR